MFPGIDPKVDIAFKRVFGSQEWRHLTIALIEAVLQPSAGRHVAELELLNPYTEPMAIDDKLSILDIKARDDQGRLFNVEMQMAITPSLPQRLLYYWSQLYGSQLARGDDYSELYPTISICFVNGRLFPDRATYHRRFRLVDSNGTLQLTDDLDMHVLELPNFQRDLNDLRNPLDFWLYFLKNGVTLDADQLPKPLDTLELRKAMEVLKMFSQDEMARELYEGRLKAERDAKMWETDRNRTLAEIAEAKQQLDTTTQQLDTTTQQLDTTSQQLDTTSQQLDTTTQQLDTTSQQLTKAEQQLTEAEQKFQRELAHRIQLCERLLGRSVSDTNELLHRDAFELQELAGRLEQELTQT